MVGDKCNFENYRDKDDDIYISYSIYINIIILFYKG